MNTLPNELQRSIFYFLTPYELILMRSVNKNYSSLITNSEFLSEYERILALPHYPNIPWEPLDKLKNLMKEHNLHIGVKSIVSYIIKPEYFTSDLIPSSNEESIGMNRELMFQNPNNKNTNFIYLSRTVTNRIQQAIGRGRPPVSFDNWSIRVQFKNQQPSITLCCRGLSSLPLTHDELYHFILLVFRDGYACTVNNSLVYS